MLTGKLDSSDQSESGLVPIKWPKLRTAEISDEEVVLECGIPATLTWFQGHFPDNPVLPGVVQLHWAISLMGKHLPQNGVFSRVENLKFRNVILPESTVLLTLSATGKEGQLRFSYCSLDRQLVHSEGRVIFQ